MRVLPYKPWVIFQWIRILGRLQGEAKHDGLSEDVKKSVSDDLWKSYVGNVSLLKLLLLLMEEIPNNHLGCINPCKYWDILRINWCRISALNSMISCTRKWSWGMGPTYPLTKVWSGVYVPRFYPYIFTMSIHVPIFLWQPECNKKLGNTKAILLSWNWWTYHFLISLDTFVRHFLGRGFFCTSFKVDSTIF